MADNLEKLEAEIRSVLLDHGKREIINNGFRISLKEEGIEITKLPSANFRQLKLPLNQKEVFEKGENP